MRSLKIVCWLAAVAMMVGGPPAPAGAQTFNSGSTGADGAFSPASSTTVTLPPNGILNYTTVNIPSGVTVTFLGNQSNTPIFMLATGDVTISGTINVDGATGGASGSGVRVFSNGGTGGPGAYAGGAGGDGIANPGAGGAGLGPGGGKAAVGNCSGFGCGGGGGGYSVPGANGNTSPPASGSGGSAYGNELNLPLIGGSGGGGGANLANAFAAGGGGGGGAILIASSTKITLTGTISAKGGNGGACPVGGGGGGGAGSGGAARLIATALAGSGGSISVAGGTTTGCAAWHGGPGAAGRIRLEAYTTTMTAIMTGSITSGNPGSVFVPGNPTLAITRIGGVDVAAPRGAYGTPDITLPAITTNPVTVEVAATNIPLSLPVTVTVTVAPLSGQPTNYASSVLAGTDSSSTASASVTLPTTQVAVLSASATFNVVLAGGAPLQIDGEEVEKIKVAALLGGPTQRFYITKAGREIPIP